MEQDETIEGDLNLSRGTLFVNGGELEVQGDYRVQAIDESNYTTECIHRVKLKSFEKARLLIDEYIYFYNHQRIQLKTKLAHLKVRSQFIA